MLDADGAAGSERGGKRKARQKVELATTLVDVVSLRPFPHFLAPFYRAAAAHVKGVRITGDETGCAWGLPVRCHVRSCTQC